MGDVASIEPARRARAAKALLSEETYAFLWTCIAVEHRQAVLAREMRDVAPESWLHIAGAFSRYDFDVTEKEGSAAVPPFDTLRRVYAGHALPHFRRYSSAVDAAQDPLVGSWMYFLYSTLNNMLMEDKVPAGAVCDAEDLAGMLEERYEKLYRAGC